MAPEKRSKGRVRADIENIRVHGHEDGSKMDGRSIVFLFLCLVANRSFSISVVVRLDM